LPKSGATGLTLERYAGSTGTGLRHLPHHSPPQPCSTAVPWRYRDDRRQQAGGGELQQILDATFAAKDDEQVAQAEVRLRELEGDLGLSRQLTDIQREEALAYVYKRPKLRVDV
jgi:hypothetical protein